MMLRWIFGLTLLFLGACLDLKKQDRENPHDHWPLLTTSPEEGFSLPYDLTQPDTVWHLPGALIENSGLSYTPEGQLALIEDENGMIYLFDPQSGQVNEEYVFDHKGDYEGIEIIGDTAYVLRSDGVVVECYGFHQQRPRRARYKLPLSSKDDAEGLGQIPGNGKLLIACKEPIRTGGKRRDRYRYLFAYDPEQHQIEDAPYLVIDLKVVGALVKESQGLDFKAKKKSSFKPSGVAFHPNGDLYVLASVGKLLLVISPRQELRGLATIDGGLLPQPEGICFDPLGNLYLSSEGKGGPAVLMRFSAK